MHGVRVFQQFANRFLTYCRSGAVLALACLALCGCGDRAQDLNRQALENLNRGNAREAVTQLETASRLAPRRPEILFNLSEAYLRLGRSEDALGAIEQAAAMVPSDAKIAAGKARLLLLNGRPAMALAAVESLSEKIQSNAEVRFYWGLALIETGKPNEALPVLEKLAESSPGSAPIRSALGLAYLRSGQAAAALQQLEQAVKLDENLVNARLYLAQYHLTITRNFDEAKNQLYLARRLEPNNPEIHLMLGQANAGARIWHDAVLAYQRALEIQPRSWKAQLGLAECSFARGEFEAAQEYARRAERDGGKQPDVLNFFGRLYTQRNQTRLAIQAYEESLAIDPNQESIQAALKKLQGE